MLPEDKIGGRLVMKLLQGPTTFVIQFKNVSLIWRVFVMYIYMCANVSILILLVSHNLMGEGNIEK